MARFILRSFAVAVVVLISGTAIADPAREGSLLPIRTAASDAHGSSVVVVEGDHLWKISAAHLETVLDRSVQSSEISPYWRDLIAVNTATLKSGDPDLIYPGEVVVLPDLASD